jgi:hypothetical protein
MKKLRTLLGKPFRFLAVNILDGMSNVVSQTNKANHTKIKARMEVLNVQYIVVNFFEKLITGHYDKHLKLKLTNVFYLLATFILWEFFVNIVLMEESQVFRLSTGFIVWLGAVVAGNMEDLKGSRCENI